MTEFNILGTFNIPGPINFILHSMFTQGNLSLNQQIVIPDICVNYSYKAMTDILLNSTNDMIES